MKHEYNVVVRFAALVTADSEAQAIRMLSDHPHHYDLNPMPDGNDAFHSETCDCETLDKGQRPA
jgi:hypothetical protein